MYVTTEAHGTVSIEVERGDEVCANCGQHIRNVVYVNGVPHGTTCAEKFFPKDTAPKDSNFDEALIEARLALRKALLDFAYAKLPAPLREQSDEFYTEFLARRGGSSPFTMHVLAVLEARKLQGL